VSDELLADLRAIVGSRLSTSAAAREHHSHDESYHRAALPDAVVFPESTEEVSVLVRACHAHRSPMIAFGAGTSLEGQVAAIRGGVAFDLTRMNRILRIAPDDLDCTVQAGVTRKQLDAALQTSGLFFPLDPGADATIGGMASTRASGTTAVRYGTMKDAVLALEVVLADGRVIRTGSRARKSAAGYDLTRLFVGAEGTLGILTELTLRLYGRPEAVIAARCHFHDIGRAVQTVATMIQLGIPVARAELASRRSAGRRGEPVFTAVFARCADPLLRIPWPELSRRSRAGRRRRRDRGRARQRWLRERRVA
jgi:D-lactate dehydrogenase (cytochrome)